ncbi:excisionase [Pseudomonas sp. CFSAN084952]|uniref:excisionase n=2 Tax=Pseudomonas TaxID=286 RepID=UPI001299EBAE|nr:excisionase [Pseudomonas sp. CFSAN084952]QGF96667.1 excisionase [Pseudomonas sp. CFSAN084952]
MKMITLKAWASLNFDPVPSVNTVRRWARDGLLFPAPTKHGRSYYINPDARYVPVDKCPVPRGNLLERVHAARGISPGST